MVCDCLMRGGGVLMPVNTGQKVVCMSWMFCVVVTLCGGVDAVAGWVAQLLLSLLLLLEEKR